jgi:hypothetical protein
MEVGGTLSMITFKVPPALGAGPEAVGEGEDEGEVLGLAETAGELAAGELAAGDDTAGALLTGGGAAVEDAGAGLAEVAGAGDEEVGELQPISTVANISRITRIP